MKTKKPKVFKQTLIFTIVLLVVLLSFHFFPLNITPSMPYGLYMRIPARHVKVGDLVEIKNPLDSSVWGVYNTSGLLKEVKEINEEGLFYVLGEHPLSYDSRYFGYIGEEYIEHKVVPIFVFNNLPAFLAKEE